MSVESRIRDLCEQVIACEDEVQCVKLIGELKAALHEHVQRVRGTLLDFPHLDRLMTEDEVKLAS